MVDLPRFLKSSGAPKGRLERLLDESERLEHRLRDVCFQIQELVDPDDCLAIECRRLLGDLDR